MPTLTAAGVRPAPAVAAAARPPRWAVLGVLFGVVSILSVALYGPIGVSGTYPRVVGEAMRLLAPDAAARNPYLARIGGALTPETMLVVGLLIGGFVAARLGRRAPAPAVEYLHAAETTPRRRYVDAFLGGFLLLFGARLAGGCTSGHIISGISQLAVSGVLFGAAVFVAGIATAKLIRRHPTEG